MPETPRSVCTDALVELGAFMYGQTPTPSELAGAFRVLNRILNRWIAQYGYFSYGRVQQRFTLTAGQGIYSMGPDAIFPNFTMPRPEGAQPGKGILSAWIVVGAGANETWYPVDVWTPEEFVGVIAPNQETSFPWAVVNDGAYPTSTITFYQVPQIAYDVVFLVPNQVSQFATLDDSFDLPPAWRDALTCTVAEEAAAGIRRNDQQLRPPSTLIMRAAAARQTLVSNNNAAPRVTVSSILGPSRGGGNFAGPSDIGRFRAGYGIYGNW